MVYLQPIYKKMSDNYNKNLASNIKSILSEIGENTKRDGLLKTPERVAKSMEFLTNGYDKNPAEILKSAMFAEDYSQMVLVKDIELYSLCEHHILPFFGKAHVAYIPNGNIVGLSKIPRIVDVFARRLQVQERLTRQIAETVKDVLDPIGVAVIMEGQHMCMQMRGVEKQNSLATTSSMLGKFRESARTRSEFLSIIGL